DAVHSHTLPATSTSPYPLGGKVPTGDVPAPLNRRSRSWGNAPCQVLVMTLPRRRNSSPQAYVVWSSPPRAACSHSASVGNRLSAQSAYACASSQPTWTTGCRSSPPKVEVGPSG